MMPMTNPRSGVWRWHRQRQQEVLQSSNRVCNSSSGSSPHIQQLHLLQDHHPGHRPGHHRDRRAIHTLVSQDTRRSSSRHGSTRLTRAPKSRHSGKREMR